MGKYAEQEKEWYSIAKELEAAGKSPSAYDVTKEQKKRMWARGERPMTYEEIVAELMKENGSMAYQVGSFGFHMAHFGSGYRLYEVCVNGNPVGVVLMTTDKDGELWFETRILAKGYEEKEVWEAFQTTPLFVTKEDRPAT